MDLIKFWIETVERREDKLVLVRYSVLGDTASDAYARFMEENAGVEEFAIDIADGYVVNMTLADSVNQA